jgi:hypothetical protein
VKLRCWLADERKDFDTREIGTQGGEHLELSRPGIGIGGYDDNASLDGRGAIGHGSAGGDSGGNLESEKRFAAVVVTVKEGNTRKRETLFPEPTNRLGFSLSEIFLIDVKGNRESVDRGFVLLQQFFDCGDVEFGRVGLRQVLKGRKVVGVGYLLSPSQEFGCSRRLNFEFG